MSNKSIFVSAFVIVCTLTISTSSKPLTYELEMATITAGSLTEMMTGTFTWEYAGAGGPAGSAVYHITELSFQSPSFTFTLNKTPYNNLDPLLLPTTGRGFCYFSEVVNTTGNLPELMKMHNLNDIECGYFGPIDNPSGLFFLNVRIDDYFGGPDQAFFSGSAYLVPEPATLFLLGFGVVMLRKREK